MPTPPFTASPVADEDLYGQLSTGALSMANEIVPGMTGVDPAILEASQRRNPNSETIGRLLSLILPRTAMMSAMAAPVAVVATKKGDVKKNGGRESAPESQAQSGTNTPVMPEAKSARDLQRNALIAERLHTQMDADAEAKGKGPSGKGAGRGGEYDKLKNRMREIDDALAKLDAAEASERADAAKARDAEAREKNANVGTMATVGGLTLGAAGAAGVTALTRGRINSRVGQFENLASKAKVLADADPKLNVVGTRAGDDLAATINEAYRRGNAPAPFPREMMQIGNPGSRAATEQAYRDIYGAALTPGAASTRATDELVATGLPEKIALREGEAIGKAAASPRAPFAAVDEGMPFSTENPAWYQSSPASKMSSAYGDLMIPAGLAAEGLYTSEVMAPESSDPAMQDFYKGLGRGSLIAAGTYLAGRKMGKALGSPGPSADAVSNLSSARSRLERDVATKRDWSQAAKVDQAISGAPRSPLAQLSAPAGVVLPNGAQGWHPVQLSNHNQGRQALINAGSTHPVVSKAFTKVDPKADVATGARQLAAALKAEAGGDTLDGFRITVPLARSLVRRKLAAERAAASPVRKGAARNPVGSRPSDCSIEHLDVIALSGCPAIGPRDAQEADKPPKAHSDGGVSPLASAHCWPSPEPERT